MEFFDKDGDFASGSSSFASWRVLTGCKEKRGAWRRVLE